MKVIKQYFCVLPLNKCIMHRNHVRAGCVILLTWLYNSSVYRTSFKLYHLKVVRNLLNFKHAVKGLRIIEKEEKSNQSPTNSA